MKCGLLCGSGVATFVIVGKMLSVGNTSMRVQVDTFVENRQGDRKPINHAIFCMVALDENDKPARVPRLAMQQADKEEV